MTDRPNRGPVVVDTDVYSARLLPDSPLARRYEPLLVGRSEFLSFQTVAELRYGALLRGWGSTRTRRLEAIIATAEIVHTGHDLVRNYAELRVACERIGHALCQRDHDAAPFFPLYFPPPPHPEWARGDLNPHVLTDTGT